MIDAVRKKTYLAAPGGCIVCQSEDYSTTGDAYEGALHWVYLECNKCLSKWTEEYQMTNIWVQEDPS